MKIVVNETHRQRSAELSRTIAKGRTGPNICRRCPVALAMRDAFPELDIQAGVDRALICDEHDNLVKVWYWTQPIYDWIKKWDRWITHRGELPDLEFDFDPETGIS